MRKDVDICELGKLKINELIKYFIDEGFCFFQDNWRYKSLNETSLQILGDKYILSYYDDRDFKVLLVEYNKVFADHVKKTSIKQKIRAIEM